VWNNISEVILTLSFLIWTEAIFTRHNEKLPKLRVKWRWTPSSPVRTHIFIIASIIRVDGSPLFSLDFGSQHEAAVTVCWCQAQTWKDLMCFCCIQGLPITLRTTCPGSSMDPRSTDYIRSKYIDMISLAPTMYHITQKIPGFLNIAMKPWRVEVHGWNPEGFQDFLSQHLTWCCYVRLSVSQNKGYFVSCFPSFILWWTRVEIKQTSEGPESFVEEQSF
jgi:hypothetical protein